jgi:alkylation response protein AidB-like acyl-CoA dehydrogenase
MNLEMKTIARERVHSPFDVQAMTHTIYGGPQAAALRERMALLIERDPVLFVKDSFDMSRPQARQKCMAQARRVLQIMQRLSPEERAALSQAIASYDRTLSMRLYVHCVLFQESIFTHGTTEQWLKWKDDIESARVLGCFAMTELGHSSFLRGIETTATYDKATQEFIIHSPTLTSTKWWIGMAGETATHTVAIARLIIDGKDHGLNWFIVQLRSLEDGALMPGVTCGDVGAKMGRQGLDNGWIQFTHVRIPLENMLMKWSQLSPDGTFTASPNPTMAYNTLIGERLVVNGDSADVVGHAVTIAIRYGAVRRQGEKDQQILDYQSHQYHLMPLLAGVYGLHFLNRKVVHDWTSELKNQNMDKERFLSLLPDYHNLAASSKAWFGWWASDALEICRRCMGGHGYSAYNAIPNLIMDHGVITTGGGDNIVLAQQSARQLMASLQKAAGGKNLKGSVAYLSQAQAIIAKAPWRPSYDDPSRKVPSVQSLVEALQWLAAKHIVTVAQQLQTDLSEGKDLEEAWNNNMMALVSCSRVHTWYFMVNFYQQAVAEEQQSLGSTSPGIPQALHKLCLLFALDRVRAETALFLEYGYITGEQAALVRKAHLAVCKEVRKDAVLLTDALAIPDFFLKAPFGCYDGDIYRKYFHVVTNAPALTSMDGRSFNYKESVEPLIRGVNMGAAVAKL